MKADHSQFCPCVNCYYAGYQEKIEKKPHKCPICEGSGTKFSQYGFCACHACDGKGVLWG